MQDEDKLHPFDPTGLTPPKGRLGHSVPTPRVLSGEGQVPATNGPVKGLFHQFSGANATKLDSWSTATDLHHSGGSGSSSGGSAVSPVQFYARRDHTFGGSLSKLERMKNLEPPFMEPFDETEEDENVFTDSIGEIDRKFMVSPVRERSGDHPDGLGATESADGRAARSKSSISGRGNPSVTLDRLSGDSLLSFSYSATMGGSGSLSSDSQLGGSFVRAFTQGLNSSLSVPGPYLPCTSPTPPAGASDGSFDQSNLFPTASRNPNKAIVTIDAHTSKILVANEMTCELFGYQRTELCGMKVQRLFTEPYRGKQRALVEQNITASGETRLVSGKVMDAVTSYGVEFPVSVWMRRVNVDSPLPLTSSPRVIVVIEPVERSSALFSMNSSHHIVTCDPWFACLFGFENSLEVIGKHISELVPSLKVPATVQDLAKMPSKQAVTGRAKDGTVFPLTVHYTDLSQCLSVNDLYSPTHTTSVGSTHQVSSSGSSSSDLAPKLHLTPDNDSHTHSTTSPTSFSSSNQAPPTLEGKKLSSSSADPDGATTINGKVVVYAALSGMVSFFPDGTIHSCNQHFALMLFGYTQEELQKKDITLLLPDFHHQIGFVDDTSIALPPLDEEDGLFHCATERSLSPDKAMEFLGGHLPVSSPSHKNISASSHGFRRNIAPLKFPDLNDYTEDSSGHLQPPSRDQTSSSPSSKGQATTFSPSRAQAAALSPRHQVAAIPSLGVQEAAVPSSGGHLARQQPQAPQQPSSTPKTVKEAPVKPHPPPASGNDGDTQGSNASQVVDKEDHALPPIPKRLVPSRSTERIMALLTQRGLATSYDSREDSQNKTSDVPVDSTTEEPLSSTPASKNKSVPQIEVNQDGDRSSLASVLSLPEGTFMGDARHKDGSLMAIVFQLKRVALEDGQVIYCMWLSRDMDAERARIADLSMSMNRCSLDPYGQNVAVSPEVGVPSGVDSTDGVGPSSQQHPPTPMQMPQSEEVLAVEGEYANNYNTLHPIGKGAFGFVKIAMKLDSGHMVVVKFLRKASVLKDCWVEDNEMGRVPLEIALLARLQHNNIIQLLEAYENEHFFQMVMEKHGEGLDLFEFIERSPRLTEQHISYIFRQMISAVAYLHNMDIVHRDIKDENIIINQDFHIKLIDFGSAAHMGPGKKFNTFCGTLEYCSPEVLLGNSYSGPELEMWAVGVTLYTLVFGENPFFDVEETIAGHLQPPFLTSPGLMKVLLWLLHPDPRSRATIPDLLMDKWTNQAVDQTLMHFNVVLALPGDGDNDGIAGATQSQATSGKGRGKAVKSSSEGGGPAPYSGAL